MKLYIKRNKYRKFIKAKAEFDTVNDLSIIFVALTDLVNKYEKANLTLE